MNTRRSFLKQTALSLGAGAIYAQQQKQPETEDLTFSSDVKVISVLATVRTKNGDIVQDLTKDDFILAEDGRKQEIKYFSRETNLPLMLGLLVDTSGSQRRLLVEEQEASFRFLDKVLREDLDRTFVVHFDFRPEVLQNITTSKEKLEKALERVTRPFAYRGGAGGTTLYDAVYLCSNLITAKQTGRKAFILLTDGDDHGSRTTLEDSIAAAQKADTLIYSILFEDPAFGGRSFGPDGKKVLQKMSRETGGGFFEVSKKRGLDEIYVQLQEELRNQYSFGYTPDPSPNKRPFRAIKLTTRRPGLVVQARSGYYVPDAPARR